MHKGSCHCGSVRLVLPSTPEVATDCNCSLCRRIGGPWVYFKFGTVEIEGHPEATAEYIWGDKTLRTIHCRGWMVEEKCIAPHVPVWDKTARRDDTISSRDFEWNEEANEYRCPQGHALRSDRRQFAIQRERVTKEDTVIYRSSRQDCCGCSMKQRCCPNTPMRKVARSIHERSRDVARAIATTPQYQQSRHDRKKVEMLFAHLKRILKLDRLRLRGLSGAQDEFLMAATAQNLRRMGKWLMTSQHTPAIMTA
jgi:Transposase DDE domain